MAKRMAWCANVCLLASIMLACKAAAHGIHKHQHEGRKKHPTVIIHDQTANMTFRNMFLW
jgi:hypothetical protein